jgi:RNA polymerase sigma-H factor
VSATDEQLARRAQTGNEIARVALIGRFDDLATMIASQYFLAGGEREDLNQEARIGLLNAIKNYRSDRATTFKTFAGLCIRRQVLTAVKTASREKHKPLSEAARVGVSENGTPIEIIDLLPSPHSRDPYLVYVSKEDLARLLAGLARLSPLERRAVIGVANGLTYVEIVEALGRNVKAVDNATQRARRRLTRWEQAA